MLRDYSSAGEHFVDIEGVTGSIPVSPTINLGNLLYKLNFCYKKLSMAILESWSLGKLILYTIMVRSLN